MFYFHVTVFMLMLFNAGRSYELLTVYQCSSLAAWSFALPVSLAVNNAMFPSDKCIHQPQVHLRRVYCL